MKLLAEETEIKDKPDAVELSDAKGEIELDHVGVQVRRNADTPKAYAAWLLRSISPTMGRSPL